MVPLGNRLTPYGVQQSAYFLLKLFHSYSNSTRSKWYWAAPDILRSHPMVKHIIINRGLFYWTITVSCLLCVTIPETPVTVTWYVAFGVSGFHCEFPPEPHPVAPNSSTQLNASPDRKSTRLNSS